MEDTLNDIVNTRINIDLSVYDDGDDLKITKSQLLEMLEEAWSAGRREGFMLAE